MAVTSGDLGGWSAGPRPFWRDRRSIALVLGFLVFALVVTELAGERGLTAFAQARDDYRALQADVARIRAENARLREAVRLLRDDPATIEEVARRDLNLIRPGEKLFIIRDVQRTVATR